jgi:hypothetical protein
LYLPDEIGVPWTGLISVSESPSGGDPQPFYYDGIKYSNLASSEEFEATIEAFACPVEFYACEGRVAIQNGLFATQQPRRTFGISYRTLIGNDVSADAGYKIHLVYNALASPGEKTYTTISADKTDAATFQWGLTAIPPVLTGLRPTAHFVVDSLHTPEALLATFEGLLYGSDVNDPYLPTAQFVYDLFTA